MATSVVNPRVQFFANNGRPLIGGRIHTYVAGSSTRARTYKDAAKAQPNTNPIVLDGRGEAQIYLAEGVEYKFVVEDSKGALIYTQEPVYGAVWPNAEQWPSDATLSYRYMLEAKAAADSIGALKFYDTYAQALGDSENWPEDGLVEIARDEKHDGARTRYRPDGAALEFVVNLDQLRIDLRSEHMGANIVDHKQLGSSISQSVGDSLNDLPVISRYTDFKEAFDFAISTDSQILTAKNITIRVPSDAPTVQDAIRKLSVVGNVPVIILIESGYKLKNGIRLENGNYRNFTIRSEDSVVYLDPSFEPVPSPEWPVGTVRESIYAFLNCDSPVIDFLVDAQLVSQDLNGMMCGFGGDYKLLAGAGVKGTRVNLEARECVYHGSGTIWDDAFEFCARFTSGVFLSGRDSSYKRSFRNPSLTSNPGSGGVLVSRGSYGTLQDSVFEDHPYSGLSVRRSHINLIGANFNNVTPWAVAYWDGGITIMNRETKRDGVEISEPDINIGGFNGIFKSGMALHSDKNPIQVTSDINGTLIKYADGFAQVISPTFTVNVSTAEGSGFKSPISTWDYSSLVTLHDDRRHISCHLLSSALSFPVLRALSTNRVSHSLCALVSSPSVSYRIVASGYWGNV